MEKNKQRWISNGLLILTAVLWGSGFVPQKIATKYLGAFAFNGFRYLIAALILFFLAKRHLPFHQANGRFSLLAGIILFSAAYLQQLGLNSSSVTNTSFITATYIVLVPFLSFIFFHKKVEKKNIIAALIALVGLYFLSTGGKKLDAIHFGDVLVFIGSVFWALHILVVGKAQEMDGDPIQFSAGQFTVCGILNFICWIVFEKGMMSGLSIAWPYVLYSGVFVIGGGFTLQVLGQRHAKESEAALILGLESVFGTIFSVILLKEAISGFQIAGAVLIMISVILAVYRQD